MVKLNPIKAYDLKKIPLMSRFVIFSIVLFLLVLVGGTGTFVLIMQQIIRTNKGNELTQMLEIERMKLETSVDGEIAIALKMAGSPLIQKYFANPENSELKKIAFEEIAAYRKAFAANSVFWVNDKDRIFYSDDNKPYYVDAKDPNNYWYLMTLLGTEKYNFNINYNPDIKVTNLWINAPVFDNRGKPIGILGTGVNLSEFVNAVYENYTHRAELYFFNAAGEITGARNLELVSIKKDINEELSEVGFDIVARAKTLGPKKIQTLDTKLGKIALNEVPLLGWYSVALLPNSISDYKTNMTGLFIAVMVVIAIIFVIFNIFILGLLNPLHKTMEELKAASNAKSEFLAKMSHEIRTPMNAIIGMAELALRENMDNSVHEHVVTIKQASTNLLSIINDILDFSKIESGKLEIIPGNYQFSSLVHDVISIIKMKVVDSNLQFVTNIDCNIPNSLFGDETRVRQVLLNILSNAVKYTKRGFVSLSVSGQTAKDTVLLTIDVTDSGKGIKPEDLKKLFGEFVQVDVKSNRGIEGTGLGLAITKNLINMMNGDISVQSEYRKGSVFTVTLPQKIQSLEPLAVVEKPEEKSVLVYERNEIYADSIVCTVDNLGVHCERAESDDILREKLKSKGYAYLFVSYTMLENAKSIIQELNLKTQIIVLTEFGNAVTDRSLSVLPMPVHSISVANVLNGVVDNFSYSINENVTARFTAPKAKVLIVDDINTNLKVAEGLMLPYKMHIDLRLSGSEAIEALKANDYDLVFMDHMMPEMDGIEATKLIRGMGKENPHYAELPIIALTANAISGTREMFLANGFNDFLSKPIDMVKLNAILAKWLPKEKQEKLEIKATDVETDNSETTEMKIADIDIKKGILMSGGTLKNYMQTLTVFYKDGFQKMNEIKKSLEAGNYPLYTTYVHALKSALANIGANELSADAKALEFAGKGKDVAFINSNNAQFLVGLKVLLDNLGNTLSLNDGYESSVDFESLKNELSRLKEALELLDSAEIDKMVNSLQEFSQAEGVGPGVESILQSVLIGGYDEAVSKIDTLLKGVR
ncbi:MAG: ATP-binding protein [Fibromonadales bacterium]|nr:ATP-binding protein [Fibromonadales bacterium]